MTTEAPSLSGVIDTAFGPVELSWDDRQRVTAVRLMPETLCSVISPLPDRLSPLSRAIKAYFTGHTADFRPFVDLCAPFLTTDFRRRVYAHVATIPYGQFNSYAEVAAAVGSPRAMRAVGGAMAANPVPLIIPCHRVVAANGLGGFSAGGGVDLKRRMLELEAIGASGTR